ncbi:MAG: SIS domain-containing protein [Chlorobi bacterium]|nr:SIS domain-containing protein [Chlorobiota bacterium]
MEDAIKRLLLERRLIMERIASEPEVITTISEAAQITFSAIKSSKKILLCGNGGSATDADHIAGELIGRFRTDRNPFPAIVLHQSTAALTAIANDYGYEQVFARQVKALGKPGDVLWAFSTSGKSSNVLNAIEEANRIGITTIAFTGQNGTLMAQLTSHAIVIPSSNTPIIQEMHKVIGHIICQLIEEMFLNDEQG